MKPAHISRIACIALAIAPLTASAQWSNGRAANAVIGQANFLSSGPMLTAAGLTTPSDVAVDPTSGKVFVVEENAHRVLRFSSEAAMSRGAAAEAVFGQAVFTVNATGTASNRFNYPTGIFVDAQGRLWVADGGNNRVLRFDNAATLGNEPDADGVLGQPDFMTGTPDTLADRMNGPADIAVDASGNLWVADMGNNRVLKFALAAAKNNGDPADVVLGQSDFTSALPQTTQTTMNQPFGVATRAVRQGLSVTTELWVADSSNNRILRFNAAGTKATGDPANGVLGQQTFVVSTQGLTQSKMYAPRRISITSDGELWVTDRNQNRVLRFADAGSKQNGGNADNVLGQLDFTDGNGGTSEIRLSAPSGVATDAEGNLFVADYGSHRVLRYSPGNPQPDNLVGRSQNSSAQRGNDIYNSSAAGQRLTVRKKSRKAAVHFTIQNDGPIDDRFRLKATRGNRLMRVKYFKLTGGRANITGAITSGKFVSDVVYRSSLRVLAKVRLTKRGLQKRRTKRRLALRSSSFTSSRKDRVLAKVILIP